ncbi:MAG TPA: DNA primase [Candidatus Paceibacterota bacterium]|nr:DNA primase [Candidatus Paceibacterota bacterium]
MDSQLEEIKSRLDIVQVIGEYVKLSKAGSNYKGLCPFHNEKTPSFIVSPNRQIFHCFGCGAGGDAFGFLMKMEHLEFPEALKILAAKAGVELKPRDAKLQSEQNTLLEINEEADKFFVSNLEKDEEALKYLLDRGLTKETIAQFGIGFALDDWQSLSKHLSQKGYKAGNILGTGLALLASDQSNSSKIYDRFRGRIMFPLKDAFGRIVGFTGRIFDKRPLRTVKDPKAVGKYVNTPQTLVYDKSKILYGLDVTKNDLRSRNQIVIVEGQMDMLMGWQNGLKNIVASSGTALTAYQLVILKKYSENLILGFDMDEAGQNADERSIALALQKGFKVSILELPEGKDMADFSREHKDGAAALPQTAIPVMQFFFNLSKNKGDVSNLDGKKAVVSYFLPKIKYLPDLIDKSYWLSQLASFTGIDFSVLEDELLKVKEEFVTRADRPNEEAEVYSLGSNKLIDRREILSKRTLALLLKSDYHGEDLVKILEKYHLFFDAAEQTLIDQIVLAPELQIASHQELVSKELDTNLVSQLDELELYGENECSILTITKCDLGAEIETSLNELKQLHFKNEISRVNNQIAELEKSQTNSQEQIEKISQLLNQLKSLASEEQESWPLN